MIKCEECNGDFKSFGSLSWHVRQQHSVSPEEYYKKHHGSGVCCICGGTTSFMNINLGYKPTCGHKCGAIKHRSDMKTDPKRFDQFRLKVSSNMMKYHADLDPVARSRRLNKIVESFKQAVSSMTLEQRKCKFGWMNKLNEEEKKQAIECMLETGTHRWWKEATDEAKQEVYDKRADTLHNTWSARGSEIMKKQAATFASNSTQLDHLDILTEEMVKSLNHTFNL